MTWVPLNHIRGALHWAAIWFRLDRYRAYPSSDAYRFRGWLDAGLVEGLSQEHPIRGSRGEGSSEGAGSMLLKVALVLGIWVLASVLVSWAVGSFVRTGSGGETPAEADSRHLTSRPSR